MPDKQSLIQIEFIGDSDSPADPATIGSVARDVIGSLQKDGYHVQPVYTGQRGGELFEIWKLIEQGAALAWQHHKGIVELAQTISTIVVAIKTAQAKITEKQNVPTTIKVTISSKKTGFSKVVEGTDPEAVARVVQELEKEEPGVIASGQTKLTAHVQQPRRRKR